MGWEVGMNRQVMDKMVRGVARLVMQFAESVKLEGELMKSLAGLGYGL